MLYVLRQWWPHEKQICGAFIYSKTYVIFFSKWKKKNGGKKFCQNYIFADSGRTLCKRLYGGIFLKGNL